MASIDRYMMGKDIFTDLFKDLIRRGDAVRDVVVHHKRLDSFSRGMWMAYMTHLYRQGRRYTGGSLEFMDTEYETVALAFQNPKEDWSNYLILGEQFNLPYMLVKAHRDSKGIWDLRGRSIPSLINVGSDVHDPKYGKKRWVHRDYKSNLVYVNYLFEPHMPVKEIASQLFPRLGIRISPNAIRWNYKDNTRELQKS
jgi:hypothetical protein